MNNMCPLAAGGSRWWWQECGGGDGSVAVVSWSSGRCCQHCWWRRGDKHWPGVGGAPPCSGGACTPPTHRPCLFLYSDTMKNVLHSKACLTLSQPYGWSNKSYYPHKVFASYITVPGNFQLLLLSSNMAQNGSKWKLLPFDGWIPDCIGN